MRKLLVVLGGAALVAGLAVPVEAASDGSSISGRFSALQRGRNEKGRGGGRDTGRGGRGDRGATGGGTGGTRYHRLEKGYYGQYFECGWIGCASEWVDPTHGSSPGAVHHFGDRFHYYDPQYYAVTYPESQAAGLGSVCDPLAAPAPTPAQPTAWQAPQQPLCKFDPRCGCFYSVSDQPPSAQIETPPVPDANAAPPAPAQPAPVTPQRQPAWAATSSE